MSRLDALRVAGVSIWLDTLSRDLHAVTGATSNSTIFEKAITGSDSYDDLVRVAVASGASPAPRRHPS